MRSQPAWARSAGQGSVEWLGLAVVVAVFGILVAGQLGAAATAVGDQLKNVICSLGPTGCAGTGGPQTVAAVPAVPATPVITRPAVRPRPATPAVTGTAPAPTAPLTGLTPRLDAADPRPAAQVPVAPAPAAAALNQTKFTPVDAGGKTGTLASVNGQPAGNQIVPGLGKRKAELLALGITPDELAIAMLENDTLSTNYPYGDNKTGDSANFGIFKQNWYMIKNSNPDLAAMGEEAAGALLNSDPAADLKALRNSQAFYGADWIGGHRAGTGGLEDPNLPIVKNYRDGVGWIATQLKADPAALTNDTRYWVVVQAI